MEYQENEKKCRNPVRRRVRRVPAFDRLQYRRAGTGNAPRAGRLRKKIRPGPGRPAVRGCFRHDDDFPPPQPGSADIRKRLSESENAKNIRGINTHLILHNRIWSQKDFIYNPHQQYLQRATVAILQQKAEQTYGKLTGMREIPLREIKKDPFGIVFRYKLLFDCIDPKTGQTHTVFFLHQETVLMAGDHYLVILSRYSSGDPKDIADCEKGSDDFYRFIRKNFQTLPTCKH